MVPGYIVANLLVNLAAAQSFPKDNAYVKELEQ
jgi:hypothetical protein